MFRFHLVGTSHPSVLTAPSPPPSGRKSLIICFPSISGICRRHGADERGLRAGRVGSHDSTQRIYYRNKMPGIEQQNTRNWSVKKMPHIGNKSSFQKNQYQKREKKRKLRKSKNRRKKTYQQENRNKTKTEKQKKTNEFVFLQTDRKTNYNSWIILSRCCYSWTWTGHGPRLW